jgi:predicted metal-dependent enzyme (double-stranded beta helix superfamily)
MRRMFVIVSVIVVVLAGLLASGRGVPGTAAQDATPAAQASQQMLGHGLLTNVPGYDLQLARVTFPPGSTVPPHTHPGAAIIYVESGSLGWTVLQGETWLMLAESAATPEAQGELVAVDTEVILTAGDWLFLPAAHGDDVRNAGDDTLVLLVANLYPAGEPPIMFMATPMP